MQLAESKDDPILAAQFKDGAQFATNLLDNPLWQYACQVYTQPGVEAALLALQDDHGADINLILQAWWLAHEGAAWTKACIPTNYEQWLAEQVQPLRIMRRNMKLDWASCEDFRQQVKKLELKAEQYALALLYLNSDQSEAVVTSAKVSLAKHNMHALAEYLGIRNTLLEQIAHYV